MKLSFVIPIYNEEDVIVNTVNSISNFCSSRYPEFEIICVNDGSTDSSLDVMRKNFKADGNIKLISYEKNRGKGFALREGFKQTAGNIVIMYDADSQHNIEDLPTLIDKIKNGSDIAIGSRAFSKDNIKNFYRNNPFFYAFSRDVLSRVHVLLCNSLFSLNIKDPQCGFKAFKKEVLRNLDLKTNSYEFDVELLVKAKNKNFKIVECPVETRFFRRRSNLVFFSDPMKMFIDLIKIKLSL